MILGTNLQSNQNMSLRFRRVLLSARVVRYGIVGCAGTAVNLLTLAVLLTAGLQRGWIPSAMASIVATSANFILHNLWTFSDRATPGPTIRPWIAFSHSYRRWNCSLQRRFTLASPGPFSTLQS